MPSYHRSVLEKEVVELMVRDPSGKYLDATLGGGGHAVAVLAALGPEGTFIGLDRDPQALAHCRESVGGDPRAKLHLAPFSQLGKYCPPQSLQGALFDLGVSSHQLDDRSRGFSFEAGTPLDMRMGPDAGASALEWLRGATEEEMAGAFAQLSDLPKARALARRIKELMHNVEETGSDALRMAVDSVYKPGHSERAGLLARVFQAVRMRVNREPEEIRSGLSAAVAALSRGGRLCVLSYHSAEDREVKETLGSFERDCICPPRLPVCTCGRGHRTLRKVIPKPLEAGPGELRSNPRARSAKLRVVERV